MIICHFYVCATHGVYLDGESPLWGLAVANLRCLFNMQGRFLISDNFYYKFVTLFYKISSKI